MINERILIKNEIATVIFEEVWFNEELLSNDYSFTVIDNANNEEYIISYDDKEHSINIAQVAQQHKVDNVHISKITARSVIECGKDFDKIEYLVKNMCRALIEFI